MTPQERKRVKIMKIYKLAAFDMDGTFLNSKKEIQPSTVEACKRGDGDPVRLLRLRDGDLRLRE